MFIQVSYDTFNNKKLYGRRSQQMWRPVTVVVSCLILFLMVFEKKKDGCPFILRMCCNYVWNPETQGFNTLGCSIGSRYRPVVQRVRDLLRGDQACT